MPVELMPVAMSLIPMTADCEEQPAALQASLTAALMASAVMATLLRPVQVTPLKGTRAIPSIFGPSESILATTAAIFVVPMSMPITVDSAGRQMLLIDANSLFQSMESPRLIHFAVKVAFIRSVGILPVLQAGLNPA
jgi:hypothetical protein